MVSFISGDKLKQLGERLRHSRLKRDEPQSEFAVRLGVSIPTLRKMETGDTSISIGLWVEALELLNRLSDLDHVLAPQQSLFEQYDAKLKQTRKRASKRKVK